MLVKFNGIELRYNAQRVINDRVTVKASYKTLLVFVDGSNICSIYPEHLTVEETVETVREYCSDYEAELSTEEVRALVEWLEED